MSSIISRASWGARFQDGYGTRPVGRLAVYGHHSVTGHSGANATYAQDCAAVRTVERVGQQNFGVGMSYTFLIPPSGRIFQGVSIGRVSAHTINRNTAGAGICFIGNYEREQLTAAQIASAAWLLDHGQKQGWWTTDRFTALHRDVFATACPGKNAVSPLRSVRASSGGPAPATSSGSSNDLTGFLRATRDTELRSGPLSTHKKVRDVKEGELLIGSGQDSQWWTGVGDLWVPKSAVRRVNHGGSSDVLHHGQYPDRDLAVTSDRTREFFLAWEDLLRRTGDWKNDGVHAAIKRWLRGAWNPAAKSGKGYGVGWGPEMTGQYVRGFKRALRDRGFFQGDVTSGAWTDELTRAEKAFLNDQRRHLTPQPPSAHSAVRGYNGKVY